MFLLKNVIVSVLAVRSMLAICQVEKSARSRLMLRKWLSMRGLLGTVSDSRKTEILTMLGLTCRDLVEVGDGRGSVRDSSLVSLDALLPAGSNSGVLGRS